VIIYSSRKVTSRECSASETVEGSSLSLKSVDDVEGGDGLSLGVLGVGDGVTDDVLEETSEDNSGLVVDERADSLDTTSSGESSDGWLGDSEDGLLDSLGSVSLGTLFAGDLSEFASLASVSWTHCIKLKKVNHQTPFWLLNQFKISDFAHSVL